MAILHAHGVFLGIEMNFDVTKKAGKLKIQSEFASDEACLLDHLKWAIDGASSIGCYRPKPNSILAAYNALETNFFDPEAFGWDDYGIKTDVTVDESDGIPMETVPQPAGPHAIY